MTIDGSNVQRDDFWQVQLATGEVCVWTLEELDEAFQSGQVHELTLVKQLGAESWSTLAEVAGIDDGPESTGIAPPAPDTLPSPVEAAPQSFSYGSVEGPSSLAPMATSVRMPYDGAPQPSAPPPAVAMSVAPPDALSADDDTPRFKSKHRAFAVAGVLAVVFAGLGLGAVKFAGTGSPSPAAAAVAPAFNGDAHHLGQGPSGDDPFIAKPLTDDQKRALLDADKKRQDELDKKRKAAEAERALHAPSPARKAGKATDPFVKGTNKYDPLNGNL